MYINNVINEITEEIENIVKYKYNKKYFVIGEGCIQSKVLIIGEAMGQQEEEQKRIFVGKSGLIVRNCLNKKFIREFFIINTMPIRPDNNKTPSESDIKLFAPIYSKIIFMPQFQYYLALGKSARFLLNYLDLKDYHHTYHPAYLIYNGYNSVLLKSFESVFDNIAESCKSLLPKIEYKVFRKDL